jgi:hypothetical protein
VNPLTRERHPCRDPDQLLAVHYAHTRRTSKEAIPKMTWFIDAMNVIGSRPDGWWRDREGAMRRFIDEVRRHIDEDATIVLDSGPDDLLGEVTSPEVRACEDGGRKPVITVIRARRKGRDAADDEIVDLVQAGDRVTTSDAALADRVRGKGASVEGAGSLRRRLGSAR